MFTIVYVHQPKIFTQYFQLENNGLFFLNGKDFQFMLNPLKRFQVYIETCNDVQSSETKMRNLYEIFPLEFFLIDEANSFHFVSNLAVNNFIYTCLGLRFTKIGKSLKCCFPTLSFIYFGLSYRVLFKNSNIRWLRKKRICVQKNDSIFFYTTIV